MKTNTIYMKSIFALNRIACLGLLALATAIPAFAADTNENHGSFSSSDYKFVCEAAHSGMKEVTLGKIASQKATDPAVQQFGQKMVADHGKANEQLMQIVSQKGATVPTGLSASEQKEVDHLNSLSGADFDKAYVGAMVKGHKTVAKEFEHASKSADDADLKSFAANTLPTIQDHLRMAEGLKSGNKVASTDMPK